MKRLIGFIMFWIAVGMAIMIFLPNEVLGILIIFILLLLGYNLFCCWGAGNNLLAMVPAAVWFYLVGFIPKESRFEGFCAANTSLFNHIGNCSKFPIWENKYAHAHKRKILLRNCARRGTKDAWAKEIGRGGAWNALLFFPIWEKRSSVLALPMNCSWMVIWNELSSFNFSASQARSTNIHLLSGSIYFTFYGFNVRLPHSVTSSMRMADILSKMCTFSTNAAFCHNCTSLQFTKPDIFHRLTTRVF